MKSIRLTDNQGCALTEKLHNAYWRMDDALTSVQDIASECGAVINDELQDAWQAHKLLWDILKDIDPAMTENIRPGDDPSPANNND